MTKYDPLTEWLRRFDDDHVTLSFIRSSAARTRTNPRRGERGPSVVTRRAALHHAANIPSPSNSSSVNWSK